MTFRMKTLMALAILAAMASLAVGTEAEAPAEPEMVDNPEYANWASFEVGAMAKMKGVTLDADGNKVSEQITTMTLTSLDDEAAVVTTEMTIVAAGMEVETPATERRIPAQVPVAADDAEAEAQAEAQVEAEVEQGEETIEVAAGTFECHFTRTTITRTVEGEEFTSTTTMWTNDEVPGKLVKMEFVSDGQMGKQTSELLEYSTGAEE